MMGQMGAMVADPDRDRVSGKLVVQVEVEIGQGEVPSLGAERDHRPQLKVLLLNYFRHASKRKNDVGIYSNPRKTYKPRGVLVNVEKLY